MSLRSSLSIAHTIESELSYKDFEMINDAMNRIQTEKNQFVFMSNRTYRKFQIYFKQWHGIPVICKLIINDYDFEYVDFFEFGKYKYYFISLDIFDSPILNEDFAKKNELFIVSKSKVVDFVSKISKVKDTQ